MDRRRAATVTPTACASTQSAIVGPAKSSCLITACDHCWRLNDAAPMQSRQKVVAIRDLLWHKQTTSTITNVCFRIGALLEINPPSQLAGNPAADFDDPIDEAE